MKGYILSILGIVLLGVVLEIMLPTGKINKFVRSIFSIFIIAVLVAPLVNFVTDTKQISLDYADYQTSANLLEYINKKKVISTQESIKNTLKENGFSNVDIILNYSTENGDLVINSCNVNLKNMVILSDNLHINKYEFIGNVIRQETNLTSEVIIFDGWKRKETSI